MKIRLWQQAASYAARKHLHQTRKDGVTPYMAHPFRVAMTIREVFGESDPEILAAALLHDVIEDTPTDYDMVVRRFGPRVADMVAAMTKDMRMPEEAREAAYDRQLMEAEWGAKLIKLADVYDNLCDLPDDKFREKGRSKAERALAIAGDDPRLTPACAVLRELVASLASR